MDKRDLKMSEFARLVGTLQPVDGMNEDLLPNVGIFRSSESYSRKPVVAHSGIMFCAQGGKNIYLDGSLFGYTAGQYIAVLIPMAMECEVVAASRDCPLLGVGVSLDWSRLAKIIFRMNEVEAVSEADVKPSGVFSGEIRDSMLDSILRLLRVLQNPVETAVLGEGLVDEIYYRILSEEQGGALKYLLQQRGQIQQISKVVEFVQSNLKQTISVDDMADAVNMSSSGFHKKFKEVMHISPLQYVKSLRLDKAKNYILEGYNVSEAGYMVGYNSQAQFSREFKRYFGVVPSEVC